MLDPSIAAIVISGNLMIFGVIYYVFTTRSRERLALLEKGLEPDFFRSYKSIHKPSLNRFLLKSGIIATGVGVGLGAGVWLDFAMVEWLYTEEVSNEILSNANPDSFPYHTHAYFISTLVFLGFGMIMGYFIDRRFYPEMEEVVEMEEILEE